MSPNKDEFKKLMIGRLKSIVMYRNNACDNYCKIDTFLSYVNPSIQELRNLTWLLQKHKKMYWDFDSRYSAKQKEMKEDEHLGWIVQSRNKIVKEEDLKIHSVAYSSLVNRLELKFPPIPIDPFWSDEEVIAFFWQLFERKEIKLLCEKVGMSVLQVKKIRIDKEYKDIDILLLIKHWFDFLSTLIFEFFDLVGIEYDFNEKMIVDNLDENKTYFLDISDSSSISISQHNFSFDKKLIDSTLKDKIWIDKIRNLVWDGKIDTFMNNMLITAKAVVQNWEEHAPMCFWLSESNEILFHVLGHIPDRSAKYVRIRKLANNVKNNPKVFAILLIWETRIVDMKNRGKHENNPSLKTAKGEALSLTFYNKIWEVRHWDLPIYREKWTVSFWELQTSNKWVDNILNPFSEVWGIDIENNDSLEG